MRVRCLLGFVAPHGVVGSCWTHRAAGLSVSSALRAFEPDVPCATSLAAGPGALVKRAWWGCCLLCAFEGPLRFAGDQL